MKHMLRTAAKIILGICSILSGCTTAVRYHDRDRTIDFTTKPADKAADMIE